MEVQNTVYYIIVITIVIGLLLLYVNHKLKNFDPLSKPTGVVLLTIMAVEALDNLVLSKTNKNVAKKLTPYIASVFIYIFISNIAGLFALKPPTSNLSVTIALAAITCILIEYYSIKEKGLKNYFKSWFEPLAPFVLINIISKFSTLLSLSLRLFGNIVAGVVLMNVIYQLFAMLSGLVPIIGQFNFIGVVIAPALHFYFDLFAGAMQAYVFTLLSVSFIGKELPQQED